MNADRKQWLAQQRTVLLGTASRSMISDISFEVP